MLTTPFHKRLDIRQESRKWPFLRRCPGIKEYMELRNLVFSSSEFQFLLMNTLEIVRILGIKRT
jgi:hypothetical protein